MIDYSDYKVWTKESLYKDTEYLNEYTEYTPEQLTEIFSDLMDKAVAAGLQNCFIKFQSTMEPYEDYLGPVSVTACGYRKINEQEKQQYDEADEVRNLADSMGIAEYQARVVYNLRKAGKL